jgi:hypothetical protein
VFLAQLDGAVGDPEIQTRHENEVSGERVAEFALPVRQRVPAPSVPPAGIKHLEIFVVRVQHVREIRAVANDYA